MHVLSIDNAHAAKLGIGLLTPRHDEVSGFGHMWLYWKALEEEHHPPFRGYYPVREQLPQESSYKNRRHWLKDLIKLFAHSFVQGQYIVDKNAMDYMETLADKILVKEWPINQEQLTRLRKRCSIPKHREFVIEGCYSWNKELFRCDNCSSWVIKIVNHVMGNPSFLTSSSPKRLSTVEKELWTP